MTRIWSRSSSLEAFAARIPGFTFACCVAAEASAHTRKGYVTAHIEPAHLNGGDVDIYLCGPPPMVEAVRGWLDRAGHHAGELLLRKIRAERRGDTIGETIGRRREA